MAENKKFVRLFEIYTSLILDGFVLKDTLVELNNMSVRTAQRDIEEINRYLKIKLVSEKDRYIIKPEEYIK